MLVGVTVETYLQGSPVAGVGGHEEPLFLEGPEPQREPEALRVLLHVVEVPDVALAGEPQGRVCRERTRLSLGEHLSPVHVDSRFGILHEIPAIRGG